MTPKQLRYRINCAKLLSKEAGIDLTDRQAILFYFQSIRLQRKNWKNILTGPIVRHWAAILGIEPGDGMRRLGFFLYHGWLSARSGHFIMVHRARSRSEYFRRISISRDFLVNRILRPLEEMGYLEVVMAEGGGVPIACRVRPRGKLLSDLLAAGKRIVELETENVQVDEFESVICIAKKPVAPSKDSGWRSSWMTLPTVIKKDLQREHNELVRDLDLLNSVIRGSTISIRSEGFDLVEQFIDDQINMIVSWYTGTPPHKALISKSIHDVPIITGQSSRQVVDNAKELIPAKDLEKRPILDEEWVREELDRIFYLFELIRMRDLGKKLPDGSIDITDHFDYRRLFLKRIQRATKSIAAEFSLGGRLYCRASSLPSRSIPLRDYILINGRPTVEIDYSAMHFRIAASEQGIELSRDFDPYWVDSLEWSQTFRERRIAKILLNALINATSEGSARKLVSMKDDYEGIDFDVAMALILSRMPWMKNYLYTDAGVRLQHVDSNIASRVMLRYAQTTSKAILCYHDSFVVDQEDEGLLSDLMASCSKEVIGVSIPTETKEKK